MVPTRLRSAALALLTLAALAAGLASAPGGGRAAQEGDKGKGKSDKQLFQGKWEVVSAEKGTEKVPEEILKAIKLEVKGDKVIVEILGETKEGTYKLDPTAKPKKIDLTVDCKTLKGIYEFGKNTLKVCTGEDENAPRPKEFKAGEENLLIVFKRAKGEKKEKDKGKKEKGKEEKGKADKGAGAVGAAKELARFKGSWMVISAEKAGMPVPEEIRTSIKVRFEGAKITLEILGQTKEGSFKVDPTKKPATIDLTIEDKTALGIYQLDKNTLKLCTAEPGEPRPKDFKAEGDKQLLVTLKRGPTAVIEEVRLAPVAAEVAAECAQEGALKTASANNLKIIGVAMHNYLDSNRGSFPPAAIYSKDGKPLLSWRVAILPYLEQGQLYKEFKLDEPWDSPHNRKLLEKMPKVYAPVAGDAKEYWTFYRVFTGPGTIFEGTKGTRITAITDGTSNTILVVEAGEAVPWTKPDELPYDASKPLPKLGGMFKDGFNALFADAAVRFIRAKADPQILRLAITRNDGKVLDLEKLTQ
jgi:uncharacterized protein (TIGR03067 family)